MAFRKFARAAIVKPDIHPTGWAEVRSHAVQGPNFAQREATKVVLQEFTPKDFLLTHCFPAGHKVLMADGTEKPIESVKVGELVLTHLGNIRPVTRVMRREVDEDLVVVRSANLSEVACTGEHPFYAIRQESAWCRIYPSYNQTVKCTFGGKKVCHSHGCTTNDATPEWVEAKALRVGDLTYTPTLHETRLSPDLSSNKLRLLGYYVAEGRVDVDSKGRPYMVRFSIHEKELSTLGLEIQTLMRLSFGVSTHSEIRDAQKGSLGVTLSFHQHEAAEWFLRHAGCGSREKRLSLDVMLAPVAWQRQMLGSWLNGDGCYDKQGFRLATSSADLASQAVVLLDRAEIYANIQRVLPTKTARKVGPFDYIKPFDGWHVHVGRTYAIKLRDVVRWDVNDNLTKRLDTKGRYRYAASVVSRIEDVQQRPFKGTVYNLSVKDDESYVIERQTVHNCTIIASVDVEPGGQPLGKHMVDGFEVNRKYADYLITPSTTKYVNNNFDAWEKKLLLACFRTFVGGENYVEHIQIPELSKGKIIDAAARDIGDSIYVDILVATNRKHAPLISAITGGQLSTLSMGCFLPGVPVTMADGTRLPIEEVAPGDMVLTHKGRVREVLNKQIRGGRWSMRRISVVGVPDSIPATDNHPFFVLRPAKVCACGCGEELHARDKDAVRRVSKRFKRGHDKRVLNPNATYSLEEARVRKDQMEAIHSLKVEQVRADELSVGDYVIFPKLDVVEGEDPGIARARLLGYFLAEGSFLKTRGEPTEVQFNFSLTEQDTFVAEAVSLLSEAFPGCRPWVQHREDRNTATVHVSGKEIAAWFKQHGGEYSHLKRLSPEVMSWSAESHRQLLGAWINGDGYLHRSGHANGTTTSYALATQMHLLAIRCGVAVRLECSFGGQVAAVSEAVVNGVSRRHEVTGKLAAFTLHFPQSSSEILAGATAKCPVATEKNRHLRNMDGMVVFPITEIETFDYEGFVYNMEVEEDNSYQVHGVATHNCQVEFTTCTKCGNVAYDETQLCPHVKYYKGNKFVDEAGVERKIAELCGHITEEPGSVKFIEASWVANPAFPGAVMRNILNPADDAPGIGKKIQLAFSQGTRVADPTLLQKAARQRVAFGEEEQFPGGGQGGDAPAAAPAPPPDPLDKAVGEMANLIRERALEKVRGEIGKQDVKALPSENLNGNLVKEAMQHPAWRKIARVVLAQVRDPKIARSLLLGMLLYKRGGWKAVQASHALQGREVLALARLFEMSNRRASRAGSGRIYRTVLAVGGVKQYPDEATYLAACRRVLGREVTDSERVDLLWKGYLYSLGS